MDELKIINRPKRTDGGHEHTEEVIELPDAETQLAQQGKDGPRIVTFGCRLNIYESEVMKAHAAARIRMRKSLSRAAPRK